MQRPNGKLFVVCGYEKRFLELKYRFCELCRLGSCTAVSARCQTKKLTLLNTIFVLVPQSNERCIVMAVRQELHKRFVLRLACTYSTLRRYLPTILPLLTREDYNFIGSDFNQTNFIRKLF